MHLGFHIQFRFKNDNGFHIQFYIQKMSQGYISSPEQTYAPWISHSVSDLENEPDINFRLMNLWVNFYI